MPSAAASETLFRVKRAGASAATWTVAVDLAPSTCRAIKLRNMRTPSISCVRQQSAEKSRCPARGYLPVFLCWVALPGPSVRISAWRPQPRKDDRASDSANGTGEFPEYGVSKFGVDYDRELGDCLRAHYRPLRR